MEFENNPTPQEDEALNPIQPEDIPAAAPAEEFQLHQLQEQPKQKKGGLIIGIVAVAAVIALVVGLLFAFGLFEKKPAESTPDTLHQAVLTQAKEILYGTTDGLAAGIQAVSDAQTATQTGQSPYGAQLDMHLLLSEAILSRLEMSLAQSGLDMDLGWLQDITLHYDMNSTQTRTRYLLDIGLGENVIATMELIGDLEANAMYIGLPTFGDHYMMQSFMAEEGLEGADISAMAQEIMAHVQKFYSSLPSADALRSCLRGYADQLLSALKDSLYGEETVAIAEVSQTYSTVTYKITEAQWCDLMIAVLEKAKTDETLKQLIVAFSDYVNGIGENTDPSFNKIDLYQEMLSGIEEDIAQLKTDKEASKDDNYLELIAYLDQQNVLHGFKVVIYSVDEEPSTIFFGDVNDGDKALLLFQLIDGEETLLTVNGERAEKDGEVTTTFDFDLGDKKSLALELKKQKDGALSIQLTPNINVLKEILGNSYSALRLMLGSEPGLRLDLGGDNGGLHLTSEGESVIGLTMENIQMLLPGEEIQLPEESKVFSGENASQEWSETLDPSKLLENLEKAGFPKELLESMVVLPQDAA